MSVDEGIIVSVLGGKNLQAGDGKKAARQISPRGWIELTWCE